MGFLVTGELNNMRSNQVDEFEAIFKKYEEMSNLINVELAVPRTVQRQTMQSNTAQKMKFSIKDFFSKCDQIRRKLRIWSHLLKKFLMENFNFCAVWVLFYTLQIQVLCSRSKLLGMNDKMMHRTET